MRRCFASSTLLTREKSWRLCGQSEAGQGKEERGLALMGTARREATLYQGCTQAYSKQSLERS